MVSNNRVSAPELTEQKLQRLMGMGDFWVCRAFTPTTSSVALKGERVRIHPGSVNARFEFSQDELENTSLSTTTLACFEEITRNESNMYVRDSTLISGTSLVLIANTVKVEADPPVVDPLTGESFPKPGVPSALLNVDDWISFRVPLTQIAQLCTLRLRLFKAFASRVDCTKKPLAANLQQCLHTTSVVLADSDHNLLHCQNLHYRNNTNRARLYRRLVRP